MALYEMTGDRLASLQQTTFAKEGIRERDDLQRYLAANIEIIDPDLLVICDEFGDWDESRRRIDLLCMDRAGRLVVIELKRSEDGGHMELQAIRYAAMIATMTLAEASAAHARYRGISEELASGALLDHLDDPGASGESFGADVVIILVSADFSKELITSVLWLNDRQLDIRCVRLKPYKLGKQVIVQSEQVVPLPEAEQFQIRVRAKEAEKRRTLGGGGSWTGAWFVNVGEDKRSCRSWEDSRRYGYLSAGGGRKWQQWIARPNPGDLVFAYVSGVGYVGAGRVTGPTVPQTEFEVGGRKLIDLDLQRPPTREQLRDEERCEHCLPVSWLATVDRENAIHDDHRRGTCVRIRDKALFDRLVQSFGVLLESEIGSD